MTELRRISVRLYVFGWIWHTLAAGSDITITTSHTIGFFLGTLRESPHRDVETSQTDKVARLYFARTSADSRCCDVCTHHSSTTRSSLPRYTQ
ncbi:hypothetical protein TNCV_196971 [Trichonephila clavipes]|uniref:Uncharacterized protein n=1 Tax=Trichonephila clavipes TaxID=2585209 RepID=A0A8X7BMB0_TRICX|nr:hypothetical protein TNCV_196971 [Trichonephila clavipes]